MGQAADEISTKQLCPKNLLPTLDETAGEIDRPSSGEFIRIGLCHRHRAIDLKIALGARPSRASKARQ